MLRAIRLPGPRKGLCVMARMKAILLAGAFVVGAGDLARAADLLPPPPPMEPAPPPVVASGFYLRGDIGVGFDELSSFNSTDAAFIGGFSYDGSGLGTQGFFGGGVGYQFNNWFRVDGTAEYRTNTKFWAIENYTAFCGFGVCHDDYSGHLNSIVTLANGYIDVGTWYGFTPYVGAGIGAAFNQFTGLTDIGVETGGYGQAPTRTSTQLAWAAMAGVSYSITPNWKLDVGYRFLSMGKMTSAGIQCVAGCTHEIQSFNLFSNDVRVGLRYVFAEVPPPAPPLVTKY